MQNILVRKNKIHLDRSDIYLYTHIVHIITEHDKDLKL